MADPAPGKLRRAWDAVNALRDSAPMVFDITFGFLVGMAVTGVWVLLK